MPDVDAMQRIRDTTAEWLRTMRPPDDLEQYRADLRAVLGDLGLQTEPAHCFGNPLAPEEDDDDD